MPRLVLEDDDGRELFAGQVSADNVQTVARFLRRNMSTLRAAAQFKQAIGALLKVGDVLEILKAPARPPLKPAPRARGGGRR